MKLPHLKAAMKMSGAEGTGLCFHRAAAFVLDTPTAELCVGVFRASAPEELATVANASPEPFLHCWAEVRGRVFAPTTIEAAGGLFPMDREVYYRVNGASDIRRMPRPEVLRWAKEIGLSAHLRKGVPARKSVGGSLLDTLGIEYRDSRDGGVVPL